MGLSQVGLTTQSYLTGAVRSVLIGKKDLHT